MYFVVPLYKSIITVDCYSAHTGIVSIVTQGHRDVILAMTLKIAISVD